MTQTRCKTCWKCGIPVLPLVSLCYHCVPLWYPCGTTGIPPKTQSPLFDDLALRHSWPRTDKCNTYNQTCIHYPFLQHQYCVIVPCNVFDVQLLGNIHFHTDPGWDTDAIVGQFSRSSIIVAEETCIVRGRVHIKLCFHLSIWINLTNVGHIQSPNPKQCTELPEVLIIPQLLHKRQTDTPLVIFECLA